MCIHRLSDIPKTYKRVGSGAFLGFLSRCAAPTGSSLLPQAWCHCYLSFLTTLPIIMFSKIVLTSLVIGALSVNALVGPVARSPASEPECESPRLFLPYLTTI